MAVATTPGAFSEVLLAHAQSRPHAVAVHFQGAALTYHELAGRCETMAGLLWHGWGVRPGERVAWLGANHVSQLALLFALARIGAVLLPLNFRLAPAELDAQIADCSPRCVVHDEAWAGAAQALGERRRLPAHPVDSLAHDAHVPAPRAGDPRSPVLLVYTSGTTGMPRAAVHTQDNLLANMRIASRAQGMRLEDSIATMLPLFHVGGLCLQTLPALYAGAGVILHPRFDPGAALECFERQKPSLTLQVPATMKALIEHPHWNRTNVSSIRALWAGSSLIPSALIEAFHARGIPVCNVYGSTETGPFSIALPPEHAMSHVGSCGWPAPEVEARLHECKDGVGEVLVRGPNVVRRYWPDQQALDADGWFHTGDLAGQAADGSYTIVGRARDLIISGGENIHPAEIEGVLAEHPAVLECAAFGIADDTWGEVVCAAFVPRPGSTVTEEELQLHLAARLAAFKRPKRWMRLQALPKTALGKVQRQALSKMLDAG